MVWYALLIAAVAVERIAELVVSQRNLAWSRARGGVEFGARPLPGDGRTAHRPAGGMSAGGRPAPPVPARAGLADAGGRAGRAGAALVVHHDAGPPMEHPRRRHPRRGAGHRRPVPVLLRTPTTSRSSSRGSRCRWCTPRGSPPWCSRCSTPHCCGRGSRSRTPRWRGCDDRPAGRGRRTGRAGHRDPTARERGSRSSWSSDAADPSTRRAARG